MVHRLKAFARAAIWALPVWAALLFLSTLTHQPDPQTDFASFAAYVTTNVFLVSHLFASILGAAIGSLGIVALMLYLHDSRRGGAAIAGMVAFVVANTLNTSVFGAAAFAQPAMGRLFFSGQNGLEIYNQVYAAPLFGTVILALVLQIAGGVLTGVALAGSGRFPKWTGWAFAVAIVGFTLSVFLLEIGLTVMSGLLVVATAAVAWTAVRSDRGVGAAAGVTTAP